MAGKPKYQVVDREEIRTNDSWKNNLTIRPVVETHRIPKGKRKGYIDC